MTLKRLKDRSQIFVQLNRENNMKTLCILTAAVFAASTGISTAALAGPTATKNQCWGEVASDVGNLGLMGEHTNADAQETPREGVLLAGKEELGEEDAGTGGLGKHADRVADYFPGDIDCEQQSPTFP
jgi:hypothetical protein